MRFFPLLLYSASGYVWWWINFGKFIKDPVRGAPVLTIAWIAVLQYYFAFHSTNLHRFRWVPVPFAICQMVATFYILYIKNRDDETRDDNDYLSKTIPDYQLPASFQQATTCSLNPTLFNDVRVLRSGRAQFVVGLVVFNGTAFVWIVTAALVFVLGCCGVTFGWFGRQSRTYRATRLGWITMLGVAMAGLFIEAGYSAQEDLNGAPIVWDSSCQVVNIMMKSRYGFYDTPHFTAYRILKNIFNV